MPRYPRVTQLLKFTLQSLRNSAARLTYVIEREIRDLLIKQRIFL